MRVRTEEALRMPRGADQRVSFDVGSAQFEIGWSAVRVEPLDRGLEKRIFACGATTDDVDVSVRFVDRDIGGSFAFRRGGEFELGRSGVVERRPRRGNAEGAR